MKKIHWNEIFNTFSKYQHDPLLEFKLRSYVVDYFSSDNEQSEDYEYWHVKKDILDNLTSSFSSLSNQLKYYKFTEHSKKSQSEFFEKLIQNISYIDFSNVESSLCLKEIQKLSKNISFDFNDSVFDNLNIDLLFEKNPNIDSFLNLFSNHYVPMNINANNLYKILDYLINQNNDALVWNKFSTLSSLQRNLYKNIDNIFDIYLQEKKLAPEDISHDKIFAECLHIMTSSQFVSVNVFESFSFNIFFTDEDRRASSLYRMSSIQERKIYSDYDRRIYEKKISKILNYKNSLTTENKFDFYTKFPILLNLLEENDFSIVSKLSKNYFDVYEKNYVHKHNTYSSFSQEMPKPTLDEYKQTSELFFMKRFSSNLKQTQLNEFKKEDIFYLISNNLLNTSLKVAKNKTIKNFLVKNINNKYLYNPVLLSKFLSERSNIDSSITLFENFNLDNKDMHKFISNQIHSLDCSYLSLNNKTNKKHMLNAFENISQFLEDESKDINQLFRVLSIDPFLTISFMEHFNTIELDKKLNIFEQKFDIETNKNKLIPYYFSMYSNCNNPIFQRYQEFFKYLLDSKLLFLQELKTTSYYNKNRPDPHMSFSKNIETIYCKFHLLDSLYEQISSFKNDFSAVKVDSIYSELKNPFRKKEYSYTSYLSDDKDFYYAPSSIFSFINNAEYCQLICNNYKKSIRSVLLNNMISDEKTTTLVKKKI